MSPTKTVPHNSEAEMYVLGAVMKWPEFAGEVIPILAAGDFYSMRHRLIYEAALRLFHRTDPVEVETVKNDLLKRGELERAGNNSYLVECVFATATPATAKLYAEEVREKARLREAIQVCQKTIEAASNPTSEPSEVLSQWQQAAFDIHLHRNKGGFDPLSDDNDAWLKRVDALQAGEAQKSRLMTGFGKLDYFTQGFAPSEFITVAADTGHGKTQFALQVAHHVAYSQGRNVAIQSLEMTNSEVNSRIQCAEARVDYSKIERPGELGESEYNRLVQAAHDTREPRIFVDDYSLVTPAEMLANARVAVIKNDVKLLIVDYLQLMDLTSAEAEREYQRLADLANWMKVVAKELDIVVMALSQVTLGPNEIPSTRSFRGSKGIGFAANISLFLHHGNDGSQILVGKNRRGPSNHPIEMRFFGGKWYELEKHREEI